DRYYADKLHLVDREGNLAVALGAAARGNARVAHAVRDHRRLVSELTSDQELAIESAAAHSRLRGAHNLDNARLAAQIALAVGGTMEGVLAGIAAFRPLPHRLEEHVFGAVTVVDDS